MLARKQEGHVDWYAGEDRLLDSGQAFFRPWDLDEQVWPRGPREQIFGLSQGARRVVSQEGRDFERHPAVYIICLVVDWPEQVSRPGEVGKRQLEEERLAGFSLGQLAADAGIVRRAVLNGVVEDRRVRRESRHR